MTRQEQIEEMAKVIRPILENRTDIRFIPDLDKPIAEELLKHYQPKLPKDSVVLSSEEYEMRIKQYKNLEIKYSNLCDNYRLCKDANETLKQHVITIRKETAENILNDLVKNCQYTFNINGKPIVELDGDFVLNSAKNYGIKTKEYEND